MPKDTVNIREVNQNKELITEPILRALPDWFGIEKSTQAYIEGVKDNLFFAAFSSDQPIGFISLKEHFPKSYEIYVMGILPDYHRKGIGKKLVQAAERALKKKNVEFFQVKTLSESSKDKNYAKTREFYLGCGFLPVEEFKTLWDEWNPCLLLIKKL